MPGAGRESRCLMAPWRKAIRGLSFPEGTFSLLPSWIETAIGNEEGAGPAPQIPRGSWNNPSSTFSTAEKGIFFSHLISKCQGLLSRSCLAALCFPCLLFLPICFQPSRRETASCGERDCLCCVCGVASAAGLSLAVIPAIHVIDNHNNEQNE